MFSTFSLVGVWVCKESDSLVARLSLKCVTDYESLVPLVNKHSLDNVPLWYQHLLMRLLGFSPVLEHVLGNTLIIADTLSHSP